MVRMADGSKDSPNAHALPHLCASTHALPSVYSALLFTNQVSAETSPPPGSLS